MGNLCSKKSNNFQGEGRILGSAPAAQPPKRTQDARSSLPSSASKSSPSTKKMGQEQSQPQSRGPGRTLGSAPAVDAGSNDPRAAAARAAEERAKKAQATGKLGKDLEAQKKQTTSQTLAQVSAENRGARTADENAAVRAYN